MSGPEHGLCLVLGKQVSDEIPLVAMVRGGHGEKPVEIHISSVGQEHMTCDPRAELHGMRFQNEGASQGEIRAVPNKMLSSWRTHAGRVIGGWPERVALRPTLQPPHQLTQRYECPCFRVPFNLSPLQ